MEARDASVFLEHCRRLAKGERDRPLAFFADALLRYARRSLPEGLEVWLSELEVSTATAAFRVVHRAVRAFLERYVALRLAREARGEPPTSAAVEREVWMAPAKSKDALGAFSPALTPEEAQGLWSALWERFSRNFNGKPEVEQLNTLLLPPSPVPLVLMVEVQMTASCHPALFAVRLPGGALQPIGDWIQAHWQEPEQLHALAEQWNAMAETCFNEPQRQALSFCAPFTFDNVWLIGLDSEGLRTQLAWFNCTLHGQIPRWVQPQDIVVHGTLGERRLSGEFNADALLDFSYKVDINGKTLSDEELARLIEAKPGERFALGKAVLPDELVEALREQLKALEKLGNSSSSEKSLSLFGALRLIAGLLLRDLKNEAGIACQFQAGEQLKRLLDGGGVPPMPELPQETEKLLWPYQLEGVRFLWAGTARGMGVCLADDMGLGKTLQVLALLQLWEREGLFSDLPALIIVPPTLLENWRAEQARWAPELKLKIFHPKSKEMNKAAWERLKQDPAAALFGVDVALFSYQMIPKLKKLMFVEFPAIILDEAQAIKNPLSKQSQAVRELIGTRRIVLTGTPVENSLLDLWTLFDFLNPGLLGSQKLIEQMCNQPTAVMPALRQLVKPFLLRRLKGDPNVLKGLPAKDELLVLCALTPAQALAYRRVVEILREGLKKTKDRSKRGGLILRTLIRLKQACNHPDQLTHRTDYQPEHSGKFLKLLELAGQIVASGERFLLFTQFRTVIDPLYKLLTNRLSCPGFVLHGGTPVAERKERIEAFQHRGGPAFFIISLRAGGVGINLTAATHVIHFDRWWNPAVENQASDRAHRFGQLHRVTVHKFICLGTLEERIDALIEQKRNLSDKLLSAGLEKLLTDMSDDELLKLVSLAPTLDKDSQ